MNNDLEEQITSFLSTIIVSKNSKDNLITIKNAIKLINKINFEDLLCIIELLISNQDFYNILNDVYNNILLKDPKYKKILFENELILYLFEAYADKAKIYIEQEEYAQEYFSEDSIKLYFKDISRFRLLTKEEELSIAILASDVSSEEEKNDSLEFLKKTDLKLEVFKARTKEEQIKLARKDFINHNLRLVIRVANKYRKNDDFLDAIQNGNLGLTKAVEKYDYQKGYKFSTYATWWIRQSISRSANENIDLIKKPVQYYEKQKQYNNAYKNLTEKLGRIPTDSELLEELGKKWGDSTLLYSIRTSQLGIARLDTPIGEEDDTTLLDFVESEEKSVEDQVSDIFMKEMVENLFTNMKIEGKLNDREIEIMKLKYGFYGKQESLDKIGKTFNISRERVSTILDVSFRKIRFFFYKYQEYAIYRPSLFQEIKLNHVEEPQSRELNCNLLKILFK